MFIEKSENLSAASYIYSDFGDGFDVNVLEELNVENTDGNIIIDRISEGEFELPLEFELQLIGGEIDKISVDNQIHASDKKVLIKSEFDRIRIKLK